MEYLESESAQVAILKRHGDYQRDLQAIRDAQKAGEEMTGTYTRSKTVRFDPITFLQVERAASDLKVTTSDYIRNVVVEKVALIDVGGMT
jgi:hypothetical protein